MGGPTIPKSTLPAQFVGFLVRAFIWTTAISGLLLLCMFLLRGWLWSNPPLLIGLALVVDYWLESRGC